MRWKHVLAVGLSLAMLSAVPVYANEPDAAAVFQELEAKSKELSDMNVLYSYQIEFSGGGVSSDTQMEMRMMASHLLDPDQMKLRMDGTMHMGKMVDKSGGPGAVQEIDLSAIPMSYSYYYENGMYYMDMMGSKVKYPMPMGEIMKAVRSNSSLMNTNLDYMQNLTMRTDGENRILTYTMDAEQMNDMVDQVMNMSGMQQMAQAGGSNVKYREISGEYTVRPDGYYSNAKMNLVADMTAQEQKMTMKMVLDISLVDPGQPVTIETPNLAEYTLIEQPAQQNMSQ